MGDAHVHKRVYLGGLTPNITSADLMERFKLFGTVSKVQLAMDPCDPDKNRGFAHFDLNTTESQWNRLVSAYNGSSWRGGKLRIEAAKSDFATRLALERERPLKVQRVRRVIRERSDMSVMTDSLVEKRPGWKRGRYGRAIAIIHMKRPDGKLITIDPDHHRENIEKLFGSVRPLPLSKLTWTIEDGERKDSILANKSKEEYKPEVKSLKDKVDVTSKVPRSLTKSNETKVALAKDQSPSKVDSSNYQIIQSSGSFKNENSSNESLPVADLKVPEELVKVEKSTILPSIAVEEGGGFSLSRLLGIDPVETLNTIPSHPIVAPKLIIEQPFIPPPKPTPNLVELLFNPNILDKMKLSDYVFCSYQSKERAYSIWRELRAKSRIDFKRRMNKAQKLARSQLQENKFTG